MTTAQPNPDDVRAVIDPLIAIFKSRKFIIALMGLMGDFLVLAIPSLLPYKDQLVGAITLFALSWMGLTAAEDVNRVHADGKVEAANVAANGAIIAAQSVANKPISSPERDR